MSETVCKDCGLVLEIGDYPFCPHGSVRQRDALSIDPITVWESNTSPGSYSFPGRNDEPCPADYHPVQITNLRQADQFTRSFNVRESERLNDQRTAERMYFDQQIKERRQATFDKIKHNARALALFKAAAEWRDRKRDAKYRGSIDAGCHFQAVSFDAGKRQGWSGPETGWRDRKP